MSAFYNEIDPYAAQWLRNLIAAGLIAPGVVDERSIEGITPDELAQYTQCHFFAGIGVWSLALRRAGWPDDRPVWTGSCPCQPFSAAGKGDGFTDERHLWPAFHHLIRHHQPAVVFGEQVASKHAEPWIDLVHADMEAMGYAFGAIPFPSAGIGAPHIRDRLYWVANSTDERCEREPYIKPAGVFGTPLPSGRERNQLGHLRAVPSGVANSDDQRPERKWPDYHSAGRERPDFRQTGLRHGAGAEFAANPTNGFWRDADWLGCRDGKWRPVEPGTFPLAHGAASRVGRLRAYGNAINAEAATQFIRSYEEARLLQELMQ